MADSIEDVPSPEDIAITEDQAASLRRLIRQALERGHEASCDEEELLMLTRGEADDLLEELQDLLDVSRR